MDSEFVLKAADGLFLHAWTCQPQGHVLGVVCLIHGLGEHSGRYLHMAEFFRANGFAFAAFDLRGHGRSGGSRGHASSYEVVMEDMALFLKEARVRYPGLPCFLYGHSLGGNLVLNFVLRRRPLLDGVIVSCPALEPATPPSAWKLWIGRLLYNLAPGFSVSNGLNMEYLSRDPAVAQQVLDDPLNHSRVSARFGCDFLQAGRWALTQASTWPLYLLLMHAGDDRFTSCPASQKFALAAGNRCTFKTWPGFYHNLHDEPEKEQVFSFVLDWIKQRVHGS